VDTRGLQFLSTFYAVTTTPPIQTDTSHVVHTVKLLVLSSHCDTTFVLLLHSRDLCSGHWHQELGQPGALVQIVDVVYRETLLIRDIPDKCRISRQCVRYSRPVC